MGKLPSKKTKQTQNTILYILLLVLLTHLNSIYQKEFVFDDRNRIQLTRTQVPMDQKSGLGLVERSVDPFTEEQYNSTPWLSMEVV